jgi:hypothetical protein
VKRSPIGAQQTPGQPHLVKSLQEQNVQGTTSFDEDSIELDILDDGAYYERILPRLQHKVRVVTEGDWDLGPLKVLEGGERGCHNLSGCEFLLPPWLIRIGATIDVVDLLVIFGEVALRFFRLFLLSGPFGRLEYFIYETLESVTVLSLMLSLGVEDADVIQEAFKFTRPGPVLLVVSQPFHHIDGMICFPLLVVALAS